MDLIFKVANTNATAGREGVIDTNFKDHFAGIHGQMAWKTLKPYIRQATREHIIPYIGKGMYDDIAGKFQNDDSLSGNQPEFLELLQDAVAYYTVYHALPTQNLVISDMGVQESISSEGTSMPVSQWRYKNTLWKLCLQADANLDALLAFMEAAVLESDSYFDLWKSDASYDAATTALFRHSSELNTFLQIHNSRRTFVALLPHIRHAEQTRVRETICQVTLDELATQVKANTLSNENATLLPYVQRLAAHWGLYLAVPHLSLLIESDGFKVASSSDGMDSKGNVLSAFGKESVVRLQQRAKEDADLAAADLLKFLYANEDDYATWKGSACYIDPEGEDGVVVCSEDEVGGILM